MTCDQKCDLADLIDALSYAETKEEKLHILRKMQTLINDILWTANGMG